MSSKKYTCIESFCGAGGLGLGLHWAEFDTKVSFDFEETYVLTYKSNLTECTNVIQADASIIDAQTLLQLSGLEKGKLDLFSGGPPCQGFSKQKRGAHLGDERNKLVLHYARLVREIEPRFFLMENVAMLGQKRGKVFIDEIHKELNNYTLYPHFYNAANYGLAQTRERFIIIGKRNDIKAEFKIPEATVDKWKTVGEVIGNLPEPPIDGSEHPDYPNHQRSNESQINITRFSYVPQGGGWRDIPEELRLPCHRNVDTKKGGWPDVYGRLEWDGQAPTITGGFDSFTRGRYGHPIQNRSLTPREAARLQGFPDWFSFYGNKQQIRHQIGNAVPPPLAKAIGEAIRNCLLAEDGLIK